MSDARRKLTPEQDIEIAKRRIAHPEISLRTLAVEYGVDNSAILRAETRGRKAMGAEAPSAIPPQPADGANAAPHDRIAPSPLNPRKRFDPEAQERMVASVRENGVLTPLLVRRANQPGNTPVGTDADYEIIGGERRWRGLGTLIAAGERPADHPMSIVLIDPCDDARYLVLALTENGQRKDMTPWEEAEAYARLRDLGHTAAQIATDVGLVKRTVEMRLRLFRDLHPIAQDALREDRITVEQANKLATLAAPEAQASWIEKIQNGWFRTTRDLHFAMTKEMAPMEVAIFPRSQYTGTYAEDDHGDPRYFADFAQFKRLQAAAIDALIVRRQEMGAAWVKVFDERKADFFLAQDYAPSKDHPKAGVAIRIAPNHAVEVIPDLVIARDLRAPTPAAAPSPNPTIAAAQAGGLLARPGTAEADQQGGDGWTRAHLLHAKRRQTVAMQEAVASDRDAAMRLVCHALMLEASGCVTIRGTHHATDTMEIAAGPAEVVEDFCGTLDGAWEITSNGPRAGHFTDAAMVWRALTRIQGAALDRLFGALVALRVTSYSGHMPDAWCGAEAMAIADHLGIVGAEADHGLAIRPGDCAGLRREALNAIKRQACPDDQVSDLDVKEFAEFLPRQAPDWYVVPTLRFLPDRTALDKAFRENASHPDQIDLEEAIAKAATPTGKLDICLVSLRRVLSVHSVFAARADGATGFPELVGEEDFPRVAEDIAQAFGVPTITADVLYTVEDLDHLAEVISAHRAALAAEDQGEAA